MNGQEHVSIAHGLTFFPVGDAVSLRDAFGRVLCELGQQRQDFFLFDADVAGGTGAMPFVKAFPQRVMQFGIAEQNMMAAAAGFATSNLIPVVTTFAAFGTMRAHEQLRTAVAYGQRNVKLCCSHLGVDTGPDGATAQMTEDIATVRAIPGMTVIVPADANELMLAFEQILNHTGPVYMRIGRSPAPVLFGADHRFEIGRARTLRAGDDVTIVAAGVMVARALDAARLLERDGVSVRVINLSTIKPIDEVALQVAAQETGAVVTAEDHNIMGGVGSAVAECLARACPVPIEFVGIQDVFGASGEPAELAEHFGLTARHLVSACRRVLARKSS